MQSLKEHVAKAYYKFRRWKRQFDLVGQDRLEIFTSYYEKNQWKDAESKSGTGSNLIETQAVRQILPKIFSQLDVKTLLDVPCGDFNWMQHVDLTGIDYTGGDIVEALIDENRKTYGKSGRVFRQLDICKEVPSNHDLILCRDALVHLSNKDIWSAISNFKASGSDYILTTTFPNVEKNASIPTGMWRPLNLQRQPFNFPPPMKIYSEKNENLDFRYGEKCLGLWRLENLPTATCHD